MRTVIIDINPGMAIVGILPAADLSTAYSFTFTGVGGQGGYTFTTNSTLPGTFALSSNGTLSGQSGVAGDFPITVTMRDVLGRTVTETFNLRVIALPITVAGTLDAFDYGAAYSDTLTISGGVAPYTVTPLAKPPWLSIAESSGTITLSAATVGSYAGSTVDIRVTDSEGASVDLSYPFSYTTLTLTGTFADGTIGTAYSSDLTISGGNGVYSLTGGDGVTVGSLPAGLSLSIVAPDKLRLSGDPTADFSGQFEASVDSGDGQTASSVQSPDIVVPVWTPDNLFAAGERGGYWNVNELTSLWQDQAGTIQANTVGDSVQRMDDLSGNGNHMIAPVGKEPVLQQDGNGKYYLISDMNGGFEYMDVGQVLPPGYDNFCMAVAGYSGARWGLFGSNTFGGGGTYYGFDVGRPAVKYRPVGGGSVYNTLSPPSSVRTTNNVVYGYIDRGAGTGQCFVSRVDYSGTDTFPPDKTSYCQPAGAYNKNTRIMLSSSDSILGGGLDSVVYCAAMAMRDMTTTDRNNLEQWMADQSGVTLPP